MRKCVKVILGDFKDHFDDLDSLYKILKKRLALSDLEGVVQPDDGEIHIVIYGPKERVDAAVDALEEFVIKESAGSKDMMSMTVEPFLKEEDYRGVFRFVQKA